MSQFDARVEFLQKSLKFKMFFSTFFNEETYLQTPGGGGGQPGAGRGELAGLRRGAQHRYHACADGHRGLQPPPGEGLTCLEDPGRVWEL